MGQTLAKKPIIIGYLIALGVQFLGGLIAGFFVGFIAGVRGMDYEPMIESMMMTGLTVVITFLAIVYGGYYAAKKAGFRHIDHGGWVGGVGLVLAAAFLGLIVTAFPEVFAEMLTQTQLISSGVQILILIPAGMLGGYLARERANESVAMGANTSAVEPQSTIPPQT